MAQCFNTTYKAFKHLIIWVILFAYQPPLFNINDFVDFYSGVDEGITPNIHLSLTWLIKYL